MNNTHLLALEQTIILDTNIIQYSANKKFGKEITGFLDELKKRGFELAISDISYCELLTNLSEAKEEAGLKLLRSFKRIEVGATFLHAAARTCTIYNQQRKIELKSKSEASLADLIIAATAILTGSLIMTANINDFPRPFFQEVEEKLIFFKENNKTQMIVLQLLSANIPIINQRFSERPKK